jgi:hypothetical protein
MGTTASDTTDRRELDRSEWGDYFNAINKRLEDGTQIEAAIDVASDVVHGTEANLLPLDGITWEDGDDQIAIGLGGRGQRYPAVLWHFVDHPVHVWVNEDGDLPTAIGIESSDGTYTFVRVRTGGG